MEFTAIILLVVVDERVTIDVPTDFRKEDANEEDYVELHFEDGWICTF